MEKSRTLVEDPRFLILLGSLHASAIDLALPGLGVVPLGVGVDELRHSSEQSRTNSKSEQRVVLGLSLEVVDVLLHESSFLHRGLIIRVVYDAISYRRAEK